MFAVECYHHVLYVEVYEVFFPSCQEGLSRMFYQEQKIKKGYIWYNSLRAWQIINMDDNFDWMLMN